MDHDLVIVNLICNELEVPRGETFYYLEGFEWNLDSAVEAKPAATQGLILAAGFIQQETRAGDRERRVTVAIPPVASSQVNKKLNGKAVEEDSSTKTITVDIIFADNTAVEISFRSDQTVRDILSAIEARRPDITGDYYFFSKGAVEYMDLNTTVHTISTGESRSLFLVYPSND